VIPDAVVQGFCRATLPDFQFAKHDQEGRSYKLPYATWQEISNPANGWPQRSYSTVGSDYVENVDTNKTEAVQIDFYTKTAQQGQNIQNYKSAYDYAEEFIQRLFTYNSQKYQRDNNIAVMSWADLTLLTRFLGDINELRATIEIFINNNQNYQEISASVDVDSLNINLTTEDI